MIVIYVIFYLLGLYGLYLAGHKHIPAIWNNNPIDALIIGGALIFLALEFTKTLIETIK